MRALPVMSRLMPPLPVAALSCAPEVRVVVIACAAVPMESRALSVRLLLRS
jgi:hypothetical protein